MNDDDLDLALERMGQAIDALRPNAKDPKWFVTSTAVPWLDALQRKQYVAATFLLSSVATNRESLDDTAGQLMALIGAATIRHLNEVAEANYALAATLGVLEEQSPGAPVFKLPEQAAIPEINMPEAEGLN